MRAKKKARFKVGQVLSVKSFYGNFSPGETGYGFAGKRGWRHGWQYGRIVKIHSPFRGSGGFAYHLDSWTSAISEKDLRPLTKKEYAR